MGADGQIRYQPWRRNESVQRSLKELEKMASDMEKFRQTQQVLAGSSGMQFVQRASFNCHTFAGGKADEAARNKRNNRQFMRVMAKSAEAERKYGDYANAVAHLSEGIRLRQKASEATAAKRLDAPSSKRSDQPGIQRPGRKRSRIFRKPTKHISSW
jgi:hypothetical protein